MSRNIKLCHPQLQELANKLLAECKKQGLIVKLGECFRSAAEQDALYAQGRTKPGNIVTYARGSSYSSMHQWGVAFDVIRNDGKGAYNDSDGWFTKVGKIGKALGLEWGGDWSSPVDKPHFQLPQWGSTPNKLKKLYGNVNNFKKTWSSRKTTKVKEDLEMVSETNITVNGKDIKINRILKDGKNYIDLRGLENAGFKVGYNADTKLPTIDNKVKELQINVDGKDTSVEAVNIKGNNYVPIRSLAVATGAFDVDYKGGKVVVKNK